MLTKLGAICCSYSLPLQGSSNYKSILPTFGDSDALYAFVNSKDPLGVEHYYRPLLYSSNFTAFINNTLSATSVGVAVGADDTAPTEDDYTLGNQITGLTANLVVSTIYDNENYNLIKRIEVTITNNNSEDVAIKEIGLFSTAATSATKGESVRNNTNIKSFMVDRTVLDVPVTIPAGEASVIHYDFVFPNS